MRRSPWLPLAAAIPFLLLHQTEDLRMFTKIERDGSGLRMMWARADASRAREITTRLREATREFDEERSATEGSQYEISRSWRTHSLNIAPDVKLQITDIAQRPLSLYNTYQWEEKISIYAGPATESEKAGASQAKLTYILSMPGRVDETSVSPPAKVSGGTVVWTLTGDKEEYTLRATSRMLRWDLLLLIIYVLAVVLGKGGAWLVHRLRSRPRRI